jgi:hypothetical protein
MAAPERAAGDVGRRWKRDVVAAVVGSLSGGAIGLTWAVTSALSSIGMGEAGAFVLAFLVLGSAAVAGFVWLVSRRLALSIPSAVLYAVGTGLLCLATFGLSGTTAGVVALSATMATFHATWFTLAFVIGRTLGSSRSAVWAAVLEGAVGFSVFMLLRVYAVV